ncbi:alpha/beta hydrolase [Nitratireductor mangrovi]|uniref:Alpha/beta hydrolase n=1 Tax=Nitratireductor mangrovi TaxID=2599600 RepID=A0A5B8KX70_9HYPH|nr:alpha/beta hydrolase [Nitratireductor mangrovi]QDZ00195.1 alpha/beta hydrolase [Nitratireductor mangrovi]
MIVRDGNLEIATEAFGTPRDPAMLLIMGAMASMLWWPDAFCQRLAARAFFVIRYDNRDTGLSSRFPVGEPGYSMADMADDAFRVIDAHGLDAAHLVGISLGGMIAQIAALSRPQRVRTLTAISTSPIGVDASRLPGMTPAYQAHAARGEAVDWSDRAQAVAYVAEDARQIASTAHAHDSAAARAFIERDCDRSGGYLSATNHFMVGAGARPATPLAKLEPPLLVIHGTSDPIFPLDHGEALAAEVSGSRLVCIEGGGHELHPHDWGAIIDAIATHAAG